MEQKKMQRISELTRIAKERTLTPSEQQEREVLRREYIGEMRASLKATLEKTYLVDEQGNKTKLEQKPQESSNGKE